MLWAALVLRWTFSDRTSHATPLQGDRGLRAWLRSEKVLVWTVATRTNGSGGHGLQSASRIEAMSRVKCGLESNLSRCGVANTGPRDRRAHGVLWSGSGRLCTTSVLAARDDHVKFTMMRQLLDGWARRELAMRVYDLQVVLLPDDDLLGLYSELCVDVR
ncbi:hypothetical protein FA95DRAFT_1394246 [Auriscalpium vulgare]|uniref:Uncharacterized protein n=1 Tax=Auriscalpium vulgare TaxID=40419 RepID=A0ACB8RQJ9_9AGAM|nr:hypothetical protein FA95DRAFT_1394246 [Auriscalpium vulgare]